MTKLNISFFGSSLVSAYWNGAATYYRGIVRALASRGHRITFYEPDIYERQSHRDIDDPPWARVVVYPGHDKCALHAALETASDTDVLIKASGIGEFDDFLESEILRAQSEETVVAFWDVDAPATLERVRTNSSDHFRELIPQYDVIFTYGGGRPVSERYIELGAQHCEVVYNALDADTHHRVKADSRFNGDLGLLANRLPDRESRVEEFFLKPAGKTPQLRYLLGGSGWADKLLPANVRCLGHVYTADHNAFNSTPRAILNVNRESMVRFGFSPATRLFEAAGAAACVITDAWEGMELFLEPNQEVLVANNGEEVLEHLNSLTPERARRIGDAAYRRIMAEHTYQHRALQVERVLNEQFHIAEDRQPLLRSINGGAHA
jgi:spore maturation protein CgeB